jgi:ATP phosphoribosyltransferase regulatory subunit
MSAWLLPDHIADVLPSEARHIEELRRDLLDTARCYGYELVMPPLVEHLESLLTGTGQALDLQTFKLVDQLSGRMMGVRADTTPQVARIDGHLLNRQGVTRLCYCGPVLHTRPGRPYATREPLQLGAEIYGHAGLEADLESLLLALECLQAAQVQGASCDLAHASIVRAVLKDVHCEATTLAQVHAALAAKDSSELLSLTRTFPAASRNGLLALVNLYGDAAVLTEAEKALHGFEDALKALSNLKWLATHLNGTSVTFDLADLRGYAYYSGARFAIYVPGASDALVRGGRYDGVGAAFDHQHARNRPAVGFSLDLRELVSVVAKRPLRAAIRAPWPEGDAQLRATITRLRQGGETVVCVLPGHEQEIDEFNCDRALVEQAGQWTVQTLA